PQLTDTAFLAFPTISFCRSMDDFNEKASIILSSRSNLPSPKDRESAKYWSVKDEANPAFDRMKGELDQAFNAGMTFNLHGKLRQLANILTHSEGLSSGEKLRNEKEFLDFVFNTE